MTSRGTTKTTKGRQSNKLKLKKETIRDLGVKGKNVKGGLRKDLTDEVTVCTGLTCTVCPVTR